ncbi:MAG: PQQ-dependent sugar dehydrogenase [Lachnospiraceae bacterium]|nr:PQQ-dependent sugar dehydrogenase [Lachnospiraceae bacterium]
MNKAAYYILYSMLQKKAQQFNRTQNTRPVSKTETDLGIPYDVETAADNLRIPWAMDIASDGTIYFTERPGEIRMIRDGELYPMPIIRFGLPFVDVGEGGLMGIVLDPDFDENRFMYVMYSYEDGGQIFNRVARLVERENEASYDRIIIDRIPGSRVNDGGRIKIGPDGKLYITAGDSGNGDLAQDLNSLAGKILRVNLDGSIPEDNPFPDSPVYSYGHRNPQGIAWGINNTMYASEHGQSGYDEINIIVPGGNYGWPLVRGPETLEEHPDFIRPIISSGDSTWAPAGIAYVEEGPWAGRLLVANLRGQQLLALTLSDDGQAVQNMEILLKDTYGRLRDVYYAPDGSLYILTSNTDGRGTPRPGDDLMLHLTPRAES